MEDIEVEGGVDDVHDVIEVRQSVSTTLPCAVQHFSNDWLGSLSHMALSIQCAACHKHIDAALFPEHFISSQQCGLLSSAQHHHEVDSAVIHRSQEEADEEKDGHHRL